MIRNSFSVDVFYAFNLLSLCMELFVLRAKISNFYKVVENML